ncbi:MAG TPA: nuclear transport factor 2 family protein [Pyrinomonadaceae bacterium]|jgi:hypothetical protein
MKHLFLFVSLTVCFVSAAFAQKANQIPKQTSAERTLLQLEVETNRATKAGDRKALEQLYADDYSGVNASGALSTKKQILDFYASGGPVMDIPDTDQTTIRVFDKTAIIAARLKYKYNQRMADRSVLWMRYTRIYALRDKNWVIIAKHFCFIGGDKKENSLSAQNE